MKDLIAGFAKQLMTAVDMGIAANLSPQRSEIQNVALLGLGGSAFGGELTKNALHLKVPFQIHRNYDAPSYVSSNTLVIASSYSGNTEETLQAVAGCHQKGATIVCITSGGELAEFAKKHNYDIILLPTGYPPRTAVGFSFVQQLFILKHFGLTEDFIADIQEAIRVLESFDSHDVAKEIATNAFEKALVLYSSDALDSISTRFRQQINENAKQLCWNHYLPEMNHNELVGWEKPDFLLPQTFALFLRWKHDHPRVVLRFDINKEIIAAKAGKIMEVWATGNSKIAQLMYMLHLADWVSLYLAELNSVDPTPVRVIDYLKNALSAR